MKTRPGSVIVGSDSVSDHMEHASTAMQLTPVEVEAKEVTREQEAQTIIDELKRINFKIVPIAGFVTIVLSILFTIAIVHFIQHRIVYVFGFPCLIGIDVIVFRVLKQKYRANQDHWKITCRRLKVLSKTAHRVRVVIHEQGQTFERLRKEFPPPESSKPV